MHIKPLHVLLCTLALLASTACDNRNIHQVVKELAEAPADTAGMQETIIRPNNFSEIEIDCFADVTFHQLESISAQPVVSIKARPEVLPQVTSRTTEGVLRLFTDRRYRMPEKAVIVINISAPRLNKATLNGVKCMRLGDIVLNSPLHIDINGVGAVTASSLKVPEVSCQLTGAGSIDLKNIDTERLTAELSGSGHIFLQGKCDQHILRPKGTGSISLNGQTVAEQNGNGER